MLSLAQLKNLHKLRYAVVLVSTQKCCYLLTLMMLACLSLCLILHLWDKRCSPTNCQALSSKRWTKPSTLNNEKTCPERSLLIQRSRDLRLLENIWRTVKWKQQSSKKTNPCSPFYRNRNPKSYAKCAACLPMTVTKYLSKSIQRRVCYASAAQDLAPI